VIRAEGLSRSFGTKRVLRGLDFEVAERDFLLVTGPNGSGKSTLLALCAGLLAPTGGSLEVSVERGELGYLAHEPLLYRELTALENLDLYGRLYRVPERRERIGMLLERLRLWDTRHERVGSFSRGMTQRLALCRALLHEPRLLLLDEPYAGLDDDGAALLDDELNGLAGERTFVVATHDPGRLDHIATERLALA
jgi:ABC-type multidrug transport system ATPase subunit